MVFARGVDEPATVFTASETFTVETALEGFLSSAISVVAWDVSVLIKVCS